MNHSTFKSFTFGIGLFFTLPLVYGNSSSPSSSDGTLYINKSKTHKVAPVKYGFHYEEIGMMGEGALHAELIRNRSFEEATPCTKPDEPVVVLGDCIDRIMRESFSYT